MTRIDPGYYSTTIDESQYADAGGATVFAVVGTATKGNINEVINCYGEQDLINKVGLPDLALPDLAVLSAIQFLQRGRHVKFVRVSDGTEDTSDVTVANHIGAPTNILTFSALSPGTWGDALEVGVEVQGTQVYTEVVGTVAAAGDIDRLFTTGLGFNIDALVNAPVVPGSVTIAVSLRPAVPGDPAPVITFTDDGDGTFTPSAGTHTATMNYVTGEMDINTAALDFFFNGSDCVVTYTNAQYAETFTPAPLVGPLVVTLAGHPLISFDATWKINPRSVYVMEGDVMAMDITNGLGVDDGLGDLAIAGNIAAGSGINYDTGVLTLNFTLAVTASVTVIYFDPFFDVYVNAPKDRHGNLGEVERFNTVVLDDGSPRYVETVMNIGVRGEIAPSAYIEVEDIAVAANKYIPEPGVHALTGGDDGIGAIADADYIGAFAGGAASGMQLYANVETQEFDMLAVPMVSSPSVIHAGLALCGNRKESIYLPDPPWGKTVDTLINWHNGTGYAHAAFNNEYAALYGWWQKVNDPYSRTEVWMPPSGFIAAAMAYNDAVSYPWNAPAGNNRGVLLNVIESEYSPSRPERESLYGYPNAVNSIVSFANQGAVIWGQKTLRRVNSAINRLNVVRMLCRIERSVRKSVENLSFEQNNEMLWARFKAIVTPFLENIRATGGLDNYTVVCDASTNPAYVRQQKEMHARIELTPTDTAEKIVVSFIINRPT